MVQLHFTEDQVRKYLRKHLSDLGDEYGKYLMMYYKEMLTSFKVSSLTTFVGQMSLLKQFLMWLKEKEVAVKDINKDVLREYLAFIRHRYSLESCRVITAVLRKFLRMVGRDDLIVLLSYPNKRRRRVKILPADIFERLIAETSNIMYKVVLAVLYETGARLSEVLNLKVSDVEEVEEGYFKLVIRDAKNGESRTVFVVKYAWLLRMYLESLNPTAVYLFPSRKRKGKPLHPSTIQNYLKRWSKKYGVNVYPHLFRHFRATQLIKEGVPTHVVMKLLGHRSQEMMKVYVHLTGVDVEEIVLSKYGIRLGRKSDKEEQLRCPKCGATAPREAKYCWRCGYPLRHVAVMDLEKERELLLKALEVIKGRPDILMKLLTSA